MHLQLHPVAGSQTYLQHCHALRVLPGSCDGGREVELRGYRCAGLKQRFGVFDIRREALEGRLRQKQKAGKELERGRGGGVGGGGLPWSDSAQTHALCGRCCVFV
jgi:hypothetical protein